MDEPLVRHQEALYARGAMGARSVLVQNTMLMKCYARLQQRGKARQLLRRMEARADKATTADTLAYCTYINTLGTAGGGEGGGGGGGAKAGADEALALVDSFARGGWNRLDVSVVNCVLLLCGKAGMAVEAEALMERMMVGGAVSGGG